MLSRPVNLCCIRVARCDDDGTAACLKEESRERPVTTYWALKVVMTYEAAHRMPFYELR
jgi:hypothetical protein